MSSADPGGGPSNITNLQETFSQQQAKITALKELVRNAEQGKNTANNQEKIRNIAQRLTHIKSKASRSKQSERYYESEETDSNLSYDRSSVSSSVSTTPIQQHARAKSEALGSEKIEILRTQMEENRKKMAEREIVKKGIADIVTQLKAKFDITQMSLEKSSELGKSIGDLSLISAKGGLNQSTSDLSYTSTNLDKERIRNLQMKCLNLEHKLKEKENFTDSESDQTKKIKELENKILDLEENLREKESVIEARTSAVSLMSESLSLKGKNTVDLLEDTKQEMIKMQNNFIHSENDFKSEIEVLKIQTDEKSSQIQNLEEKIKILEKVRYDLTVKNSELEGRVNESENQKYDIDIISEAEIKEMNKDDHVKKIHALEEEVIKLQQKIKLSDNNLLEKYEELDTKYKKLEAENLELVEKNNSLEELITEKSIEYNVLQANFAVLEEKLNSSAPKSLFSKSTDEVAEAEITKLKIQLDDVNKSGIKMKLKIKQLQKQLDNFKKESNLNNEVVRLTEETQSLQQKIIELEEEKGQLQLKLVHDDSSNLSSDPEMENKLKLLEQTCQNQTSAIQLLEEQKVDLVQDLLATKHELSTLKIQMNEIDQQETSRVSSHYNEIEYEEKLEKLKLEIVNLQTVVENANAENQRLLDNIDQLQLERGSSNESIEIVEKLTQQEKQELEDYEKFREKSQSAAEESKPAFVIADENNIALSDSLIKLREESSELLHKIDLFTNERCEVLEKMEILTIENVKLKEKLQEFEDKSTRREDIPLPDETYVTNIQQLETEIENIKKNKDKTLKSKTKKLLQESQKICELTKMLVNDHKLMLAETNEIRVELKHVKEKQKELQEISYTKGQEEIERLNSLLLEAKNIEDDRESLEVQLKKSKNRISENDSTIKDLNNEIETLKNENENVLVRLENMKLENAHYENKVTTLSSDIAVLEVDNERLKNTIKEIEVQIEDYQTRFKSSNEQMEILKTLVSEQKKQLIDTLTEHEQENQQNHDTIESLKGKLARNNDNDNLKSMLNQQEEDLHYKQETIDALNKQIIDLYATMEETTNQMTKQQNDLQDDFDHKLSQIDQLNKEIKQLTHKLNENNKLQTEMSLEIKDLKNKLNENQKLESNDNRVKELEKTVNDMENKNKEQLDKLKKYAANLKKKVAQCTELEEKLAKAKASNEITRELELKVQYVTTLEQEIALLRGELNKTTVNLQQSQNSQSEIKELLGEINNLQLEISNQNQINSDQNKIIEDLKLDLTRRERALDMFEVDVDSMNNQIHEKTSQIENYMAELENLKKDHKTLADDVVSKTIKIDKCKAIIKEKNKEIQKLNNSIENLNVKIEHLQQKVEIYEDQEKDHSEQKIIERLNAKVQENLLYIETIEMENSQFKEKVYKLEDGIRNIEDRRLSLERHASILDNELKEKTNEFSENEDLLVQRLTALSQHDEIMEKRLKEVQNENIEIGEILKETKFEKEELNRKLHHLQNHISFLEESKIHDLEKINNDLLQQVEIQKTEMKRMHSEFEKKMYDSKIEIDEMEQNYTITIDGIQKDKKEIEQFNEKLRDENNYIQNEILQLRETNNSLELQKEDLDKELCYIKIQYENNQMEIRELTVKISEKQNEIDHLRQQNQAIAQNYDTEVNSLKTQLADLDSMNTQVGQNQTDDQAMLQQENTKLRELLVEKENEIERYNQTIDLSAENAELRETIQHLQATIELKENEFKSVRQSLVRQTSHQEIDSVLSAAEDCVQQIQNSPVLKNFNWEDLTQSRQKYENDIKNYTKTIENLENEIENLKIYTHDLEERFKNVHVIREESLRKLAEKTQLYEELHEINKNLERQISLQQHQQPSNTTIQLQDAVPSFDSSIFFGQSQSVTPFDEEVQVKSIKSVQSATVPFVPDTNIAEMKLKFEREIQYLIEERDNLQRQLNEIRHLNEKCVKQNNELENKQAQNSSSILTNFFESTPADTTDSIFANFSSAGEVHTAQAVEDVIFAKKAYLCGPSEQEVKLRKMEAEKTPTESMEILFDDQSWGWEAEPQSLDSFSMQNSNLAYEKIIDEIKIENRELQFLLNDWKTKFNNMSLQNLEINSSCIKNQEEILNLKSQLETLTDENAENLTQLGQCNYQLQELNQLNSTYSEKIVKLELIISNNSEKLAQLEEYRSRCDELNALNTANKCEIKKLEDLNAKYSFENGNQLKQIKHNEELIGECQNRIEQLQQTVQTNIDLHTKYEEISLSNIAYQNQVKQLEESIQNYSQLHQQLHQYQQEIERLNQLICEYQNRIKELDEFTHGTAEAAHQQSIQIVELNNTNSEYKKEIERLNEIIRERENQKVLPQQELIVESQQSNITPFDSTAFFNQGSSFDFFNVQNEPFLGQENEDKQPVTEEVIVPKQAYICGTTDDDGWGFDTSNEVVTEQLQKSSAHTAQSLIPANVQSQIEIQEYQDKIQELELEKLRMGEEIVQLKIKSGKLIKKLKEYKNEMDKPGFKKSSSVDSTSDLDLAIQEELNNQIKKLEERLKESKSDLAKHTLEKENLNKRIDVLTSANDRMTEMKERQDQDIKNYQYKVKELHEKLHQLEQWDDENYNKDTPTKVMEANQSTDVKVLENSIKLLKAEINDLKIDNDELQAILDEEKSNNTINESKLKQIEESSKEMLEKIKMLEINLKESLEENSSLKNEIERMKTASLFQSPEFSISTAARPQFIDSNRINELEIEIQNLTGQLQYKDSEILHLNQKISDIIKEDQTQSLVQEILTKNYEINVLKQQVQTLTQDREELENNLSVQITHEEMLKLNKELQTKTDEIVGLKQEKHDMENELKILNDQVIASLQFEDKMKSVALELDCKNIEINELKNSLAQLSPGGQYITPSQHHQKGVQSVQEAPVKETIIKDEDTFYNDKDTITKMQDALESQEIEIVTLKEQLAIRSAEYARLASQLDPFGQYSSSSIKITSNNTKLGDQRKVSSSSNNREDMTMNEIIPRAELDLALYMLHQRDMRCEELTLELVHLLEERDTLQLKLSNSLRQTEEIRRKAGISEIPDTELNVLNTSKSLDSREMQLDVTKCDTNTTSLDTTQMKSKLTELHGIDHARDKRLQEDRENRQRQMTQLQKDISNIPSEAVAHLVGADYTLSRTSQSPSSVLFNWLMGKSTPRAPPST